MSTATATSTEVFTSARARDQLLSALRFGRRSIPVLMTEDDGARRDEQTLVRQEKFAAETALMLYAADVAAGEDAAVQALVTDLAAKLSRHVRSGALLTMMRLRPSAVPELITGHTCLTGLGHPDVDFDLAVRHVLENAPTVVSELRPWKNLEADWCARVGGVLPRVADLEGHLAQTTLAQDLDAFTARRLDLYAFTHAIMYLADFGRQRPELPREAVAIEADADAALARCLDDDDFDLAGEVLLTWPYLRIARSATADFGLSVLARVHDDLGFLPSLQLRVENLKSLDGEDQTYALFNEAYHTNHVMGLLAAAMLLPGGQVGAWSGEASSGGAEVLLDLLPDRQPIPQWQKDFEDLSAERRDQLADMLAAIALRRSIRLGDLRQVRDLLEACVDLGVASSPAVGQAAQLLQRFSPPSAHSTVPTT